MKFKEFFEIVYNNKYLDGNTDSKILKSLMSSTITLPQIQKWLLDISRLDEDTLATLAALMEVHPLGFKKFVLYDDKDTGIRARLHYWPQNNWSKESIHDHRFDFYSTVVCGSYVHEVYEEPKFINEKAKLKLKSRTVIKAGETYYFPAGVFHRIIPTEELTISFLIRGKAKIPNSRVIDPNTLQMRNTFGSVWKFKNEIEKIAESI